VAAECRDRKLDPPPDPRLVAQVDAGAAPDPLAVRAVFVAAGSGFEPTGEALLFIRDLLGRIPAAATLFAAAAGADSCPIP
jgi:hypothetical protein